ncbi:MAG: hypothetical protein N2202_03935 [Proteobacteria bacterium]|nr:hypothetical protein [Pseudomonadota bacterium]
MPKTHTVKVTFGAKYRKDDILYAEGNITYKNENYLWTAKESHYGLGWEVEIHDNGKIEPKDADFLKAAISSSIDRNIVETRYKLILEK